MKPFSEGLEKLVGKPWSVWEPVVSWVVWCYFWTCLGPQPELSAEVLEKHNGVYSQAYIMNNTRRQDVANSIASTCLIKWHSQRCVVVIAYSPSWPPFLLLICSWNPPTIQDLPWVIISQSIILFIVLSCCGLCPSLLLSVGAPRWKPWDGEHRYFA